MPLGKLKNHASNNAPFIGLVRLRKHRYLDCCCQNAAFASPFSLAKFSQSDRELQQGWSCTAGWTARHKRRRPSWEKLSALLQENLPVGRKTD